MKKTRELRLALGIGLPLAMEALLLLLISRWPSTMSIIIPTYWLALVSGFALLRSVYPGSAIRAAVVYFPLMMIAMWILALGLSYALQVPLE